MTVLCIPVHAATLFAEDTHACCRIRKFAYGRWRGVGAWACYCLLTKVDTKQGLVLPL